MARSNAAAGARTRNPTPCPGRATPWTVAAHAYDARRSMSEFSSDHPGDSPDERITHEAEDLMRQRRFQDGCADQLCHLAVPLHWIVLAQWMPNPFVRHHDAAQVGMPFKSNAKKIEDFTLIVVGRGPNRCDGRN